MRVKEQTKKTAIPRLSHLQFAVLDILGTATMRGKNLRARLSERDIRKSGPAFYQMMARLEQAKFVKGWYEQQIIDGQIIKERQYKITGNGIDAYNETKTFYNSHPQVAGVPSFA